VSAAAAHLPLMQKPRAPGLTIFSALVFAFLYLPIIALVVYSFNGPGVGGFPPRDLTLHWYAVLLEDTALWNSVLDSLMVAFAATAIALVFGLCAALAL